MLYRRTGPEQLSVARAWGYYMPSGCNVIVAVTWVQTYEYELYWLPGRKLLAFRVISRKAAFIKKVP